MPMDGLTLGFMARELRETLTDGRIEKVSQPEKDMLVLVIRAQGKNHKLLLSAAPSFARAHLTDANYQNPADAPMFCMLMRKHLQGGRLTNLEQLGGDRVLVLTIENKDELGDTAPRELYLELMGRHSNLTLVKDGRIVDAIRHVSGDMSRVRQALPGLPFVPPPAQDKIDPAELISLEELFSGRGTNYLKEGKRPAKDGLYTLRNASGIQGSTTLFYPGVKEKIGEFFEAGYYAVPSSVHEFIIVPENGNVDPDALLHMLTEGNSTLVGPEDVFSGDIYRYNPEKDLLEIAATSVAGGGLS